MKIQFYSDLHIEMLDNSTFLRKDPPQCVGDVLVLAGDIMYFESPELLESPFWDWASNNFKEVLAIPGNHEFYYGYDLLNLHDGWEKEIRHNVHYYYNKSITIGDVEFVLTTLWSSLPEGKEAFFSRFVTDFYRIKAEGDILTPGRYTEEHRRCMSFLTEALKRGDDITTDTGERKKRIVVTHHAPLFELGVKELQGGDMRYAFATDLKQLMDEHPIDYWIFGHSHYNTTATYHDCHCICNQLGYTTLGESGGFDPRKIIEI